MAYLKYINACNNAQVQDFIPFYIETHQVGFIRPAFAHLLLKYSDTFIFETKGILLNPKIQGFKARTQAFSELIQDFFERKYLANIYNEAYPIYARGIAEPLCCIDRFSASYFGIRAFGQHLNGIVKTAKGVDLWIAKRAKGRVLFPDKLDNMVAGGLPYGITHQQNLIKEGFEEAGMSEDLCKKAHAVSVITYNAETEKGLRPDVLYCYDIILDDNFVPHCTDGEVQAFYRLPVEEVIDIVKNSEDFKLNCNLVIIDFLIRWGYIEPQDPNYVEIVTRLHTPLLV